MQRRQAVFVAHLVAGAEMSEQVADQFETQAVKYLYRTILMEEEHRPLPEDQSPALLAARVRRHVNTVDWAIGNYERECEVADLTAVAVQLMWLGAAAITAAVHMDPDCVDLEPTDLKDELLGPIDSCVAEAIEDESNGDFSPRDLLEPCTTFLAEADDWIGEDDSEMLENASVSLWNVANSATIALALIDRRRVSG
jgi:hypothetical protein